MADPGNVHGVGHFTEPPSGSSAMPPQPMTGGAATSPVSPFATAASLAQASLARLDHGNGGGHSPSTHAPNSTLASTLAAAVARHELNVGAGQSSGFLAANGNGNAGDTHAGDAFTTADHEMDTHDLSPPNDPFASSTPSKQLLPPGVTPPPEMLDLAWRIHSVHPMDASIDGVAAAKEAWVCCENTRCGKWRRVPSVVARAIGEGDEWLCSASRDSRFFNCDLPQELDDDEIDRRVNAAALAERNVLLAEAEQLRTQQKDIEKREKKRKQDYEYRERKKAKMALERRETRVAAGLPPDSPPKPPPKEKPAPREKIEKIEKPVRREPDPPPKPPPPTFHPASLIRCENVECGKLRVVTRQVAETNVGFRKRWVCVFNHTAPFEERNCLWPALFPNAKAAATWRLEQVELELAARQAGARVDGDPAPAVSVTTVCTKKEKKESSKAVSSKASMKECVTVELGTQPKPDLGFQPDLPRGTVSGYVVDAMTADDEDAHDDPKRADGQPRLMPPPKPRNVAHAAVPARCGGHPGVFLSKRAMFRCMCDESLENCVAVSGVGEGNVLTTTGWERHCGMEKSKNWRTSVTIVCSDRPGLKIGVWLDEVGIDVARGKGGGPGGEKSTTKPKKGDKTHGGRHHQKAPVVDTRWQPAFSGPFEQTPLRFLMRAFEKIVDGSLDSTSDDDAGNDTSSCQNSSSRDEQRRWLARVCVLNKTWSHAARTVVKANGWETWRPLGASLDAIESGGVVGGRTTSRKEDVEGEETGTDADAVGVDPANGEIRYAKQKKEDSPMDTQTRTRDAVEADTSKDVTDLVNADALTEETRLAEEKKRLRREKDKQRRVKDGFVDRVFEFDSAATRAQLVAITEYVPRGDPDEVEAERTVTLSEHQPSLEKNKALLLKIKKDEAAGRLPKPPHLASKHEAHDAIDRRVKVFWPEEKEFFFGVVTGYDEKSKKHTVTYDDGDVEAVTLAKEKMEWLEPGGSSVLDKHRAIPTIGENGDIADPAKPPGWWPVVARWPVCPVTEKQLRQKTIGPAGTAVGAFPNPGTLFCLSAGKQVAEQETYGVDYVTARDVVGTFRRVCPDWKDDSAWRLADALMMQVNASYGALPIDSACTFSLALAAEDLAQTLERDGIVGSLYDAHFSRAAAKALWALAHDARSAPEMFAVHRKGFGVTCSDPGGIKKGDLVVDFLGEMYPPWAWMAKQDAIKTAQKAKGQRESGPPEFYNMQLERPSGDAEGFALLFVDAMHHNNYSSRLSHSCDPNVEVSLRAIDGKYCINFYAKKHIKPGEELCYNYHSCTDNMKEVEAAFCLCGARLCRASYLAFVGEQSNSHVLTRCHRLVERHAALFAAGLPVSSSSGDKKETPSSGDKTEANSVLSSNAISALAEIGLYPNKGLLRNAPGWLVKYVGSVALFMAVELKRLPKDILREHKAATAKELAKHENALSAKKWAPPPFGLGDAEIEALSVRENRTQSIAICLSKVRYLLGRGGAKKNIAHTPAPFRYLETETSESDNTEVALKFFGPHQKSLVKVLVQAMAPHARHGDARSRHLSFCDEMDDIARQVCGSRNGVVVGGEEGDAGGDCEREDDEKEDDGDDEEDAETKITERAERANTTGKTANQNRGSDADDAAFVPPSMSIKAGLLWLRDKLSSMDVTPGARHDIAADLVHLHAHTQKRWVVSDDQTHRSLKTEPIAVRENEVNSFGIGAEGASAKIVKKIPQVYKPHAAAMSLLTWYKQDAFDSGQFVNSNRKGCVTLPDVNCAYSPRPEVVVARSGRKEREVWLDCLRKAPDMAWPMASGPWGVSNHQKLLGSPALDVFVDAHQRGWGTTRGGDPVEESDGHRKNDNKAPPKIAEDVLEWLENRKGYDE